MRAAAGMNNFTFPPEFLTVYISIYKSLRAQNQ